MVLSIRSLRFALPVCILCSLAYNYAVAACTAGNDVSVTKTIEMRETGNTMTYFDTAPLQTVRGIDAIEVVGFELRLRAGVKALYAEYSAPALQRVEITHYEAKPGTTLVGNAILLGLPLLFAPKRQFDRLLGCDEERFLELVPDEARKQATGKNIWKNPEGSPQTFRLTLEGLGTTPSLFDAPARDGEWMMFNLKGHVMASPDSSGAITITCDSCVLSDEGKVEHPSLALFKTITADFASVKEVEVARVKREQEEAARQVAEQKAREIRLLTEQRAREAKEREAREQREREIKAARAVAEKEERERKQRAAVRDQLRGL